MNKPIKQIAELIVESTGSFDSYHMNARRDEEGRVTFPIESNGNEKEFAGPFDMAGNYFYLRYREGFINYEEVNQDRRFAACESFVEQVQPVRLVGFFGCGVDAYELESTIRNVLLTWKQEQLPGVKGGKVILRQSNIDSIQVSKEEFIKPKKFDKNLQLILFDFDVSIEISATCSSKTLTL